MPGGWKLKFDRPIASLPRRNPAHARALRASAASVTSTITTNTNTSCSTILNILSANAYDNKSGVVLGATDNDFIEVRTGDA